MRRPHAATQRRDATTSLTQGDLVQDVWAIAAGSPAKLAQPDGRTLSWLIGIAKRCAPGYAPSKIEHVPIDGTLAREAGDDLEGRGMHEDVEELTAEMWGKDE